MKSTQLMNATWRAGKNNATGCYGHCTFYSAAEMRELISYGSMKGVRLVPSTGKIILVGADDINDKTIRRYKKAGINLTFINNITVRGKKEKIPVYEIT